VHRIVNQTKNFFLSRSSSTGRNKLRAAIALLVFASLQLLRAVDAPVQSQAVDNYHVATDPNNLASTVPSDKVEVFGQPRMTQGHPCTFWDQEDIDHYKEMLKTNKELQTQLADLKADIDQKISQPFSIPDPQKGLDGKWLFPGEYFPALPAFPNDDAFAKFSRRVFNDEETISALGTLYALTGEAKYGDYGKAMILAYARDFPNYGKPPLYNLRNGSGILSQLLGEGLNLTKLAYGYDMIYNLPSWTAEERKQAHDLLGIFVGEILYPREPEIDMTDSYGTQANNRGVLTSTGVLMSGYAADDPEWVNAALYGIQSTIPKPDKDRLTTYPPLHDWTAGTADHPFGGMLANDFGKCIGDDGMWIEGSPGYALYAGNGLITSAEILWHHGIDMYRYRNGVLKRFFDYPLVIAYPDMTLPALNDSNRNYVSGPTWEHSSALYEYAYRRYQDSRYLNIIFPPDERTYLASFNVVANTPATVPEATSAPKAPAPPVFTTSRSLHIGHVGSVPISLLYDLDPNTPVGTIAEPDMNFATVGFGILRVPGDDGGLNNLILSYGPTASHGHPDKLAIDLYAFNDVLAPSPGVIFPYNNPLIPQWYHTTLAHNTLTVDEKSQDYLYSNPKSKAHADQLVYGPASTMGLQRAWTDSVYSGVTMDRALFLTPHYMADLFGAFSSSPHKYDLAWHIRGEAQSNLNFAPVTLPAPAPVGYSALANLRRAVVDDQAWSVTMTRKEFSATLLAAGAPATSIMLGDGGHYSDFTNVVNREFPTAPTIIERRENISSTIYGNVIDLSNLKDGYVKSVTQEGSLDVGYSLLKVETVKGNDLCFASYRPGNYTAGDLQTDAMQAMVCMDGANVRAMYLGGGTALKTSAGAIRRSKPGLAYFEQLTKGSFIVNPSPADALVTVTLPALAGLKARNLDEQGKPVGDANLTKEPGTTFVLQMKATTKVEFTP
jgi:hypothetical protein